jgi:3-phytase
VTIVVACGTAPAPVSAPPPPPPGAPADAAPPPQEPPVAEEPARPPVPPSAVVAERWETTSRPEEDLGAVAVWPGAGDRPWLLATAEATDRLLIFDAGSGELLRELGAAGDGEGRFRHPRGLAVADDLAFVAEIGNARVQVLRLPGLSTVGFVALDGSLRPDGVAVAARGGGVYELVVGGDAVPPAGGGAPAGPLGPRALSFEVRVQNTGAGDEMTVTSSASSARSVVDWRPPVEVVPRGRAALYPCSDGDGYWLTADGSGERTEILVLARRDLRLLGRFTGERTASSDGIALSAVATPELPAGAVYAIHENRSVTAFDWRDVAVAFGLRADCAADAGS